MDQLEELVAKYEVIIFDLGNTLIDHLNPEVDKVSAVATLRPGVTELLNFLNQKVRLSIVSNTTDIGSKDIRQKLAEMKIESFFSDVIATSELGVHKPDPQPIIQTLNNLNVVPESALYIGDLATDKSAAKAAGVDFMYTTPNIFNGFVEFLHSPNDALDRALATDLKVHAELRELVQNRFDSLVKPPGSLGRLEEMVAKIAAASGNQIPTVDPAAVAVFIADHGVASDDSVTPWPQMITQTMGELAVQGKAAISILSRVSDIYLEVINVGTISPSISRQIVDARVSEGTKDFRFQAAMDLGEVKNSISAGAESAERLIAGGSKFLAVGEIGIGNTTASAAIISYLTSTPATENTGRGSGIDDATLNRKRDVVNALINEMEPGLDAFQILGKIGGFEIAAICGFILRAASLNVPVMLDGVITQAAALLAQKLQPKCTEFMIASHASAEPSSQIALKRLGLDPLLDLGLRLGEGTGAALALPLLRSACLALQEMAQISEII